MDVLPDFKDLDDSELKRLIEDLVRQEEEISYQRRLLHGKIDILRAELVDRIKRRHGGSETESDVDTIKRLTEILAHRGPPPSLQQELDELERG
jgi:hypothetical protein